MIQLNCLSRYLIVDWERSNFSLSQCLFEEGSQQKLVAIEAVSSTTDEIRSSSSSKPPSGKNKTAGIAVGVTLAVVIISIGLGVFFFKRRQGAAKNIKSHKSRADEILPGYRKTELNTDNDHAIYEMDNPENAKRLAQTKAPHEMDGVPLRPVELAVTPSELHGSSPAPPNLSLGKSTFRPQDRKPLRQSSTGKDSETSSSQAPHPKPSIESIFASIRANELRSPISPTAEESSQPNPAFLPS